MVVGKQDISSTWFQRSDSNSSVQLCCRWYILTVFEEIVFQGTENCLCSFHEILITPYRSLWLAVLVSPVELESGCSMLLVKRKKGTG